MEENFIENWMKCEALAVILEYWALEGFQKGSISGTHVNKVLNPICFLKRGYSLQRHILQPEMLKSLRVDETRYFPCIAFPCMLQYREHIDIIC